MNVALKQGDIYRGAWGFRNSPAAVRRFPLPFPEDRYMYSVNIEPHAPGPKGSVIEFPIDCDEHYIEECHERAIVLDEDPLRYRALPHMMSAQWDTLELGMQSLSQSYPQDFTLSRQGRHWHWINRPLELEQRFTFGDPASLPYEPLEYITRQLQGDWVIMDQRDNDLWCEGGMATGPADWSLDFDLGMSFKEWHGPVPLGHEMGVFDRALKFLTNLRLNEPVRRYNWTMTVHPRLDTSPHNYDRWGSDRATVIMENVADVLHLRTELQGLWRLPRSNGVVFMVRTYMLSLQDVVSIPKWARRVHRVLRDLHPALADYKGLARHRAIAVAYLAQFDDGTPTTAGPAPE
jgi:dimethylamine monooxygenase subunit A